MTVTARAKDDDDPRHHQTWHAKYVIGADGARSTVRDLLGVEFPGKTILSSVVLADVLLADGPTSGELTLGSTADVIGFSHRTTGATMTARGTARWCGTATIRCPTRSRSPPPR